MWLPQQMRVPVTKGAGVGKKKKKEMSSAKEASCSVVNALHLHRPIMLSRRGKGVAKKN